ncbi:MAG: radical SAM protein [Deltaproteobacteria bacterium]|nr:radical SAM protein [Deltaproteobacteria bacterium]
MSMDIPFPKYVEWQITAKCTQRCLHCSNVSDNASFDLSTASAVRLIHQLADENVKSVTLSGGEPFARDDWELLVSVLKENCISVQIITNGTLVDSKKAAKLKSLRIDFIWLSLDGPKSIHNFIRQSKQSFDDVMHATELLVENKIPFGFMTTLLQPNYQMLPKMAEIVQGSGAALWQLWLGNRTNHRDIWLSNTQINELLATLPTIRLKAPQMIIGDNIGYSAKLENLRTPGFMQPDHHLRFRGCFGGREVIGIRNNGAMQNCLALPISPTQRTVDDLPIGELHQLARGNFHSTAQSLKQQCAQCDHSPSCSQGCPAHRLSQSRFQIMPYCFDRKKRHVSIAQTVSASILAACAITATHCHSPTGDTAKSASMHTASSDDAKKAKPMNPFALPDTSQSTSVEAKTQSVDTPIPQPSESTTVDTDTGNHSATLSQTDPTSVSDTSNRNASEDAFRSRPCMMSHVGCRDTFEQLPPDPEKAAKSHSEQ